jgi:methionyl-tRNA formyltransferase
MTKIFFLGTPNIAIPSLQALAKNKEIEIIGVGVFPDKPVGRKRVLTPCAVKKSALELGLPIYEIESKQKLVEITNQLDFDLGIVIAFGMIFPAEILERNFFVNVHFSLLPEWRGASPVQSAILNGQSESGITWQRMVYALDAGNILLQKKYDICTKNTMEVWNDFAEKTAESWDEFFSSGLPLEQGELPKAEGIESLNQVQDDEKLQFKGRSLWNGTPQDASQATFCGKFQKSDGLVNPKNETAFQIHQKLLAFTPWPGIYMETKYGNLKILDGRLEDDTEQNFFALTCKDESILYLKRVQLAGKKPTLIKELLNGYDDIFIKK